MTYEERYAHYMKHLSSPHSEKLCKTCEKFQRQLKKDMDKADGLKLLEFMVTNPNLNSEHVHDFKPTVLRGIYECTCGYSALGVPGSWATIYNDKDEIVYDWMVKE